MQLLRLAAVLTAVLPALASAAQCTEKTAEKTPDSLLAEYTKIEKQFTDITEKYADASIEAPTLRRREASATGYVPIECTSSEKCYYIDNAAVCYDEKTTILRVADIATMNLKNGDITLPGGTKGNVFEDVKPIEEYLQAQFVEATKTAVNGTMKTNGTASLETPVAQGENAAGRMVVGGWVAAAAVLAAVVVA